MLLLLWVQITNSMTSMDKIILRVFTTGMVMAPLLTLNREIGGVVWYWRESESKIVKESLFLVFLSAELLVLQ